MHRSYACSTTLAPLAHSAQPAAWMRRSPPPWPKQARTPVTLALKLTSHQEIPSTLLTGAISAQVQKTAIG
ncbi:hypothetical protein J1614_011028 [Plenodomus biglobosus]|nr:hypothetical protein J1614_011028 [Plenodomus biglobosus]